MSIKKSGMISIIGRPNVGKSTLTNALVGEKVAIVSNKPQTTRNRICAILNRGESQFVFLDTPGLHKARTRLGDYMVNVVKESVADVDAVMLLVEPIPNVGGPEAELIARIKTLGCPSVLVINKVDTLEHKEELLEVIQTYGQAHEFTAVVPVSARTGEGVPELLAAIGRRLDNGARRVIIHLPYDQGGLLDKLYQQAKVESVEYGETIDVAAVCTPKVIGQLGPLVEGWRPRREPWED